MSAQMLAVSLLGVGTVLRLGRDDWSNVKLRRQATNEYATPPRLLFVSAPEEIGDALTFELRYGHACVV